MSRATSSEPNDQYDPAADWPGKQFGLPNSGPRSIARFGRRIAAFAIDIGLGAVISLIFFGYDRWASLIVFVVMQILFIAVVNGSVGHLVLGMRLVPLKGGVIGFWRPVVRTLLVSIIIPAVITDQDKRGMHDRIAGTVLVKR